MVRFLNAVTLPEHAYVFAVCTCGGEGCSTIKQVGRILRQKGRTLSAGFEVKMVNNYVPFGIPNAGKQAKSLASAGKQVAKIIEAIEQKKNATHRGWVLLNWLLSGIIYRQCARWFSVMDHSFRVDANCNGCGICRNVCPAQNIGMSSQKPVWQHHCDQCWACLHWCPKHSIQMGKLTANKKRYHHPDITLTDIMKSSGTGP
jgi:Pyruvate/2-oxoacid:ferredoxin oxidoreductase delta subunit